MIESIAITNFYCFNETTKISFVAGRERNRLSDILFAGYEPLNHVNMLKMAFLYGDNGAGKSKIMKAFEVLQELVTESRDDISDPLPYEEFAFDPMRLQPKPSEITLVYHFDRNRYRYYIKWNERYIIEEKLEHLKPASEALLFHRIYDKHLRVVQVEYGREMNINDDTAYVIRTGLQRNNSVFSIINNTNIYNKVLHDQMAFFKFGFELLDLTDIDLGDSLPDGKKKNGRALKKVILALLASIGSNITDFEKIPLPKRLPSSILSKMKNADSEQMQMMMELFDIAPDYAVRTFHDVGQKRPQPLDLEDQSEGTKEIMRMIICMHEAIAEHKTILLDDCINGIHPKNLAQLMKFFLGVATDAQLIIASQNFSSLDEATIRRDSLRFVVKNKYGESRVDQLALGALHKNQNLRNQVENNPQWGVMPTINDVILENAIMEYKSRAPRDGDDYYSELF